MSDYLYMKYGGDAVTGAFNFSYTEMLDGRDQWSFMFPNQLHEHFETWDARINQSEIEIWDSTGTDTIRMKGIVTGVSDTNPLQITGEGEIVKMTWTTVTPERAKFQVDEVYIKSEPTDEVIECVIQEADPDPGWGTHQWIYTDQSPKYAIISDNTIDESVEADLQAWTDQGGGVGGNSSKGNSTDETNDEDSTRTEDTTFWECEFNDPENNYHYMYACVNFDDHAIGSENIITKIDIDLRGRCGAKNLNTFAGSALWGIYWSPDGTWSNSVLIQTVSHNRSTPVYSYTAFALQKGVHSILVTPDDNTNHIYFTVNGGVWTGGYIYIRQILKSPFYLDIGTAYSKIDIDYLSVDVYYQSLDLTTINRKIKDTTNDVGGTHDELILLDDDGSSDYDASGKGISIGDKVTIGIGMTEAFARCFQGERTSLLGCEINGGEWIDVGIGDDLGPQDQYSMFTSLAERNNYVFFARYFNYENETNTTIYCLDPDDIAAATVTYSAASDPPSLSSIQAKGDGEYGYIRVIYKNGITPLIQADTPSSSPVEKTVTKKDILTLREAMDYGKTYANQHATKRYSISCDWQYYPTNLPHIGVKYNVTVSKAGVGTIAYTDQICRTVTVTQDGGYGQWSIHAEFGLLSTTGEEWIGKEIAEAHNKIKRDIALSLTGQYSPVTRHAQLNGVLDSQHNIPTQISTAITTHAGDDDAHHAVFENLVEDTTPQLGGILDCQQNLIDNVGTIDGKADVDVILSSNTTPYLTLDVSESQVKLDVETNYNDQDIIGIGTMNFQDGGSTVDIIRDEDDMASDDANALATQQSIKKYVDDEVAGAGGGKGIAAIPIWGDSNTPLGPSYVVLTDAGSHNDYVYGRFYLDPDVVDTSADITIIWVLNCDDADAAVTIKKYVGSIKTDNSEDYAFNIDNGSADSFDSTNAAKITSKQWTIANAGIADDDMLIVALGVNETGRIITAFGCWAVYTKV